MIAQVIGGRKCSQTASTMMPIAKPASPLTNAPTKSVRRSTARVPSMSSLPQSRAARWMASHLTGRLRVPAEIIDRLLEIPAFERALLDAAGSDRYGLHGCGRIRLDLIEHRLLGSVDRAPEEAGSCGSDRLHGLHGCSP